MSTIPPVSDPRFDADYNESEAPKQKRSVWATCLIGCLVTAVIVFVLGAALIFWIMRNARGWTADFASQAIDQAIDSSRLPQQEKDEIKIQTGRVVTAFRDGRLSGEQIGFIMQKIAESPLLASLMVAAIDTAYIQKSGLTDEEKTAANETLQRFLRGMMDEKIGDAAVDTVMVHVAVKQPNGNWRLREKVSDAELRAFLAAAKAEADKANIEPPPADFDPSEEFKRIIDEALDQPAELEPPVIPPPGE